jgi:hypothetical protein
VNITATVLISLAMASCTDSELPEYSKVEGLRVLALVPSVPEAAPGDSLTITPLVSDINGNGRVLKYNADVCIDPGVAYGATPQCENTTFSQNLVSNQGITGLSGPEYTGNVTTVSVTIPVDTIIFAARSEAEKFNGIPYIFSYEIFSETGDSVKAFKRILVTNRTSLNKNPIIKEIRGDSGVLSRFPSNGTSLIPTLGSGSFQSYNVRDEDGNIENRSEVMTTTWFVSEGRVKKYRTQDAEENRYEAPGDKKSDKKLVLIAVTRDGRGGIGTLQLNLQ